MLPIIIYFFQTIVSTGRIDFLRLSIYVIFIFLIISKIKSGWRKNNNIKIFKIGISGLILISILFYILGNFTGKTSSYSFIDTISIYIGSPIITFDYFLNGHMPSHELFGQETLYNVYNFLRNFNSEIPVYSMPLEFYNLNGFDTNIYTALRRYISDYSYVNTFIIVFFIGFIYKIGLQYVKKSNNFFVLIIYSMYFFPVVEFASEERFLINILSINTVYIFIYMSFFYYILIYKRIRLKVRRIG